MTEIKPPIEEWLITCNIDVSDRTPLVINDIPNQIKFTRLGQTINVLDSVLYPNNASAHILNSRTISGYASKNQIILGEYLHTHTDIEFKVNTSEISGTSGTSGASGIDGTSGTSGTSGIDGTSGTDGASGMDGTSGTPGTSGTSGTSVRTNTTINIIESIALEYSYDIIFCDTDKKSLYISLPAGINGAYFKIINCGDSKHDAVIVPNGSELLFGNNSPFNLMDAEIIDINYNPIQGWW